MNSKKVFSNLAWRFAERIGAQGVKLVVELILARLLVPEDYGLIALVTVVITILNVLVDSGLGNALIQKYEADDLDFSSVFWFNLALCLILYFLLFLCSPLLAQFYKRPELTPIIRVLGLQIIISGVKNVEQAYVSRSLQFRKFFFATLGGTISAAVLGIWMAYHGYGVWALVGQHLLNMFMDTVLLWVIVRWHPRMEFSFRRLKTLLSYGWKLLASALLDTVYGEIRQLIIGKLYSSEDLAFYNRGEQFPRFFVSNVNSAIDSVLMPTMSREQKDYDRLKSITRRAITTSTYIMAPFMVGLAVCAEPLVRIVLTEKWLPCVPFLRIFCITYMFYPIHTANLNAIQALGRSDLFLKLEIAKKVIGMAVLLSTMWFGPLVMACSALFTSIAGQIINSWPNKKLLNYPYLEQLKDILPGILLATGMGAIVYCVQFLGLSDLLTLLIQVPLGAAIYIAGSKLFHLESFDYVLEIAKSYLKKRNGKEETI